MDRAFLVYYIIWLRANFKIFSESAPWIAMNFTVIFFGWFSIRFLQLMLGSVLPYMWLCSKNIFHRMCLIDFNKIFQECSLYDLQLMLIGRKTRPVVRGAFWQYRFCPNFKNLLQRMFLIDFNDIYRDVTWVSLCQTSSCHHLRRHVRLVIRRLRVRTPPGRQHSFVEIDHEIFSTVILSLPLIQERQLSVSGERMCTILVNRLED